MSYRDGLIAYWEMEEAAGSSRVDGAGSNDLAEDSGSIPQEDTLFVWGDYSVGPFSTSFLTRADADLSATFPGKNGGSGTAFTIGFWLYVPSGSAAVQQVLTKGSGKIEAWWDYSGSVPEFNFYVGGKQITLGAEEDAWHLYTVTYDGTTLYGWYDIARSSGQTSLGSYTGTSQLVVGCFDPATDNTPWEGYVDSMYVYDRALEYDEILRLFIYGLTDKMAGAGHAITNFSGFEMGDPKAAVHNGILGGAIITTGGTVTMDGTTKRTGNYSLKTAHVSGTGVFGMLVPLKYATDWRRDGNAYDYVFVDVWVYFTQFPASTTHRFLTLRSGGDTFPGTGRAHLEVTSGGTLTLDGTAAGSPTALSLNTWYRIGWKCHKGTGVQELRINGVREVTVTGTPTVSPDSLFLGHYTSQANNSFICFWDDLKIEASNTEYEIDWPEDRIVKLMKPAGVGDYDAYIEVIPSGSEIYQVTDEVPLDDDTSYVLSPKSLGTRFSVDLESVQSAGIRAENILAVKPCIMVKSVGAASNAKGFVRSGSTDTDGTATSLTGNFVGTYYNLSQVFQSAWTESLVEDLEIGLIDNSTTQFHRVTQIGLEVLYELAFGMEGLEVAVGIPDITVLAERAQRRVTVMG